MYTYVCICVCVKMNGKLKMALQLSSSPCSLSTLLPPSPRNFLSQSKSKNISIRCQVESSSSNSSENTESTATSSTVSPPSDKSIAAAGVGFGSTNATSEVASKKNPKGKKERASVIRRAPLSKPTFASQKEDIQEQERSQSENAFLLAWIGLGGIILLEGIVLAASGFLREEWDKFLVKYLYPSFTPTVFLFVAGTVVYGVQKYLQNEKPEKDA